MNLDIRDLQMHYIKERALDGLSMKVSGLRSIAVIGPSGGGKSTLLRVVAGLEVPTSGYVAVNGRPIDYEEKALREYRKRIGVVFQAYNLFPHWTALQNITVPLAKVYGMERDEAVEKAMALLKKFNLEQHAGKLPVQLSGGQQQRISIARAMAREPEILLLDEPTSALDPQLTKEVLDMVLALKEEGTNIMMATHEMAFAKRASDHVFFIDEGKVAKEGSSLTFFDSMDRDRLAEFLSHVFD
ncbi:MAG: amino acid ABC transporter ATP-binding protein [Clostridia bacterium]|nr:amino acid ABC transporter ATP-binding protein [Clostridia bacterium]